MEKQVNQIAEKDPVGLKELNSPYLKMLYNLLAVVPILLVASAVFYIVSMFSSQGSISMGSYLSRAQKWNEEGLSKKFSEISFVNRIMPSHNTEENIHYMEWVSMTTEGEGKDAASS